MSISINNFSPGLNDIVECVSLVDFSVDVTDTQYDITTSGTYFILNDEKVATTYITISGGYNCNFSTIPSGNMFLTISGSNSNDEFYLEDYVFDFGYNVNWNYVANWGNNQEVPIAINAKNNVKKPSTTYFSTFFHTHKVYSTNLEATITADGSGNRDIVASIHPQSKYFLYGKTYSIIVSGIKDFSGNILDETTFTFKIEEDPNG